MALELDQLSSLNSLPFDQVIDVRSPSEFALDHLPGAINLPVLSDEERAHVGTVYVQQSRFSARKMGAALVARNAARHLEGALADKDGSYRALIYCWRGGQRSGAFASILSQIGWRVETLKGGYRSYRRLVVKAHYDTVFPAPVVVLGGNTGTAKTDILNRLGELGHQVIDLEGLANHRGSLFGAMSGGQPSQKAFEGALASEMTRFDPDKVVVVEAESGKIGNLFVPPGLWQAMQAAPRIILRAPLAERAAYLMRAYGDVVADPRHLLAIIGKLKPFHATDRINAWVGMAESGDFHALATQLMEYHYDPRYRSAATPETTKSQVSFEIDDLSPNGVDQAANALAEQIGQPSADCPDPDA